tara:strand:- start:202 stop:417 length:216 start_codon:yes stop_codon:yes gene_type:complete
MEHVSVFLTAVCKEYGININKENENDTNYTKSNRSIPTKSSTKDVAARNIGHEATRAVSLRYNKSGIQPQG